jgi:hypothetical protein
MAGKPCGVLTVQCRSVRDVRPEVGPKLILELIFDANLQPDSFAFTPASSVPMELASNRVAFTLIHLPDMPDNFRSSEPFST